MHGRGGTSPVDRTEPGSRHVGPWQLQAVLLLWKVEFDTSYVCT
jgi:hypothetical protein